jgi:SAM-dependent methyltransferase
MLDHLHGLEAWEIVEREDGFFSIGAGPELYFASHGEWRQVEREAISRARGRVLDVGCGAGRMMLHLREQGVPVTGIDISPAAIEACRRQGLEDVHARTPRACVGPSPPIRNSCVLGSHGGWVTNVLSTMDSSIDVDFGLTMPMPSVFHVEGRNREWRLLARPIPSAR